MLVRFWQLTWFLILTTDEERKQFRDKFLYSEQELAAAKGREKVLQEQLLMEMNNSQERYTKALQSCHDLEVVHLSF